MEKDACNIPKLGGVEEAGEYLEKTIFGGVPSCEIQREDLQITKVGFYLGNSFYAISKS
jgi:hypothetical protein